MWPGAAAGWISGGGKLDIEFAAIGLITRELIADKMLEDRRTESEKAKEELNNRRYAQGELNKILVKILKAL